MTLQSEFYTTVLQTGKKVFCHKSFVRLEKGGGSQFRDLVHFNESADRHTSLRLARRVWVAGGRQGKERQAESWLLGWFTKRSNSSVNTCFFFKQATLQESLHSSYEANIKAVS